MLSANRESARRVIPRAVLLRLDVGHKAIALAVQRAHETRGPPLLPQRLAQRRDTGFQDLVPDELVGPQVLKELLLGDNTVAMLQEVGEHLKDFAPQLERLPSVLELIALGVQDIGVK